MSIKKKTERWKELQAERLKTIKDRDEIKAIEDEMRKVIGDTFSVSGNTLTIETAAGWEEFDDAVEIYHILGWLLRENDNI